jgi:hypothetical protein
LLRVGLLAIVVAILANAGPIPTSGSGDYYTGEYFLGTPVWDFSIANISCQPEQGPICWQKSNESIGFSIGLQPVAGVQDFGITEIQNGISTTQEYETLGTITSNACVPALSIYGQVILQDYICTEAFTFSVVAEIPIFSLASPSISQLDGVSVAVVEPGSWLLLASGLVFMLCWVANVRN